MTDLFSDLDLGDDAIAETLAFNTELERKLATLPQAHELGAEVTRQARRQGLGVFPAPVFLDEAETIRIPGRAGDIPLRILRPQGEPQGVYLHLHGGGWVLGAEDLQDVPLRRLAREAGVVAVSVGYRLAPEHPFPAGPDDCEDAARWLLADGAERLGAPLRVVIGGESAGGHLSALTLLRLRDGGVDLAPFVGANLVYGAFDLSGTPSVRAWGERNLILSGPLVAWFNECFMPGLGPEERRDPALSPLFNDLRGMPPALFTCGTQDPLLDDTLFMAARWVAAGNRAATKIFPEGIHAFNAFPSLKLAAALDATQRAFVRDRVAAGHG